MISSAKSKLGGYATYIALALIITHTDAFQSPINTIPKFSPSTPSLAFSRQTISQLSAKKKKSNDSSGKGFGANPLEQKRTYDAKTPPAPSEPAPTAATAEPSAAMTEAAKAQDEASLNTGKMALNELRRRRSEERDEELRKLRELRTVDDTLKTDPGAASIPEKVAMRMGKRMLPFVGIPLFGGMAAFVGFWYMATYRDMEFQPALVAISTIALLGVGLLGITYSVLSASWDDDREGSFLGVDEFQKNIGNLKQGLNRSRDNAILREKAAGLSEEEVQSALRDLDKREKRKEEEEMMKKEGLKGKLERELE
eukprot:CAMPEP_0185740838 /NCGR_PEP_ID=MMETSP1171-20130828/38635_1 /TAXON_ID=374046 /ORGANISM="Helicotheca tamensis, Strain CCMP826" /LENGTH=311 /DNA_ID=CAMNT_0028412767 /DNA_START=186 /DNA_END=1121 /DNA_ORIENTATION=+